MEKNQEEYMKKHGYDCALPMLLALWLGLCSMAAAGELVDPAGTLTLTQALALAEARHPDLEAARLETQAAEGRVVQASVRPNPTVSFEAENFGGKAEQKRFEAAEYTAQVEQTLEWGGKRGKRLNAAQAGRQVAGVDLEAIRLDIRAETNRRFLGVLGAQARVSLARETVALAEGFVRAAEARVKAGKVPPTELEKAQILLAQNQIALDQARNELETARIQLAAQWGSIRPVFEGVAEDLLVVPEVPPRSAVTARYSGNPDVARWVLEIEQAQAVLAQEKAARVPDLTLAAGLRRSHETDSDTWVAGVSLPLPVFDRNQGGIREAESLLDKAKQQQRAAEVKAATDLAAAYQALAAFARKASALKDDVMPRVKAVLDAVQSGYAQGKHSSLEVLDAQRTLVESKTDYIDALMSARLALADLERFAGGPLPIQK